MFRKIISSFVSISLFAAPLTPASAEQFIFRHTYPLGTETQLPSDPSIEVGNDIVAYYTAPVGKPFEKRIPVKTTDVADWRVVSGSAASGIDLDQNDGIYEGTPDVPQVETQTLEGYDPANRLIAKADVHFTVIKPEGVEVKVSFFAHTGQYSYNVIPSPAGVDVENWVPLMTLAPGMDMRNEALEGAPTAAGVYTLLWQGYDYLGKPVAYAWGDFTVTDGPIVAKVPDMSIDPGRGQAFNYTPTATNAIGSVSWKLVDVDGYRPSGLTFKSIDGKIGGQVSEFGMSRKFQLVVTDAYDGTSTPSNVFRLSTAVANFSMKEVPDRQITLNEFSSFGFYATTNIKELVWSLDPSSGPLPAGMRVNAETGRLEGSPKALGEFPGIIVRVDGTGGFHDQTNAFKITVFDKDIRLSTTPVIARVGKPFQSEGVKIGVGRVDPVDHAFLAGYTPLGDIRIAADSGKISSAAGFPDRIFFNVPITVKNGDGQPARNVTQNVGIYPDIDLRYEDFEFTRFGYADQLSPTVDYETLVGDVEYTITPALPTWLKMDPYGRIRLDYANPAPKSAAGFEGTFVVSVTDAQGVPVPSNPFAIRLKDRAAIKLEAQNGGVHQVERYVSYSHYNPNFIARAKNAFNGVTYKLTATSQPLPDGLVLSTGGWLERRTSVAVGDYTGIEIVAEDGDAGVDTYGPFTLSVVADTGLRWSEGELAAELTWVEGRPFTLQLPKPYNARHPVSYSIKSGPSGLSIDANGLLSGSVATAGIHTVEYEIDDDTSRDPITGIATLSIEEPFEFGPADWKALKGTETTFAAPIVRGIKPFTYTHLNPQDLPAEGSWRHYSGNVRGTATSSTGGFPVSIKVKDRAGVEKTFDTVVDFAPPAPLDVSWSDKTLYVGEDTGLPMEPELSDKTISVPSWALSGALPNGVGFDSASGTFFANPAPATESAGIYPVDVIPSPSDPDVALSKARFPVTLKVGYSGDIGFSGKTFGHRVNKTIEQPLSYSRAVAPVKFTAINLGPGVSFDEAAGKFSASFAEPGSYSAGNIKIEENDDPAFNREKTSSFGFQIYPELAVTVPAVMSYGQYDQNAGTAAVTENLIGDGDPATPDLTYALAAGYTDLPEGLTVNPTTGAVEGTPEVFGEFGPFAITAFDAYGDSKNSNEFSVAIAERKQMTLSYNAADLAFHRFDKTSAAPTVLDGYAGFTWSINPTPAAGIEFDSSTGVLTASTTDIIPEASYRVTVVDRKGGAKGSAHADVRFGVAERPQLAADYPVSEHVFKRHNTDTGIVATATNRVSMGGALEYSVAPTPPSCIGFDPTSGRISANCSIEIEATDYTVTVTDDTYRTHGNTYGRLVMQPIKVSVGPRDPITLSYEGYDKVGQTFGFIQHQAGSSAPTYAGNLTDVTWSIIPAMPAATNPLAEGLSFDYENGTIHSNGSTPITASAYVVTVKDDKDGETSLPLMIGVDKRKDLAFATDTTQEIVLNSEYELSLEVENALGDVVHYELVSGTLPSWLHFDADGSGDCGLAATFCGAADVADHGKTFAFTLRATDDFDGDTGAVEFSFTVVEDATPMTLTYGESTTARVGYAYTVPAGKVEHAIGNYTFSAPALAQYGLSIDPKTGVISGTPNSTFDVTVAVTVTDKLGPSRATTADLHLVSAPSPRVEVSIPTNGEFNRAIPAEEQPYALDSEGVQSWSVQPHTLPTGVSLDPATGQLLGTPQVLGTFGPYTLTLADGLPGNFASAPFMFDIVMNKDPIELEELSVLTKVGFRFETKAPDYDNNYGAAVFSSPELAALGLTVDRTTGVVSGSLASAMDVRPNLVIRDTTTRTTSMPVGIKVLPRMRLTAPETVTLTALDKIETPISVTRTYVAGTAAWNPMDPTVLPEGVTFDTATGTFVGTPTRVQTLAPVTVSAIDTFGAGQTDTQSSNPITFVVKKGPFYMEFNPGELPVATKRSAYSFDLVANDMFDFEGMDMSEIVFKIESADGSRTAEQMEALLGLKVVNGVLTGTSADEGEFDFYVTATFSDRAPVTGLFHLKMVIPETKLELASASLPNAKQYQDWSFDFKTILTHDNVPLEDVVWGPLVAMPNSQQVEVLPPDMTFANGVLSGKPMLSGEYVFKVSVSFADRSENLSYEMAYSLNIEGISYKFKQVAFGGYGHACALTVDGGVLCWGRNSEGQVGNGDVGNAFTAKEVVGLHEGAKSLSLGYYSSCALMVDGTAKCWGENGGPTYRLLATGSTEKLVKTPETVTQSGIVLHSRGFSSSCFVLSNQVRCTDNSGAKNLVSGLSTGISEISSGKAHQCVRMKSGEVRCWGVGSAGQLGNGETSFSSTPVPATGVSNAVQVSAMNDFTCALTQAGAVMCWGTGYGATPAVVPELESGVSAITTGHTASNLCVIMQNGGVKCKGNGTAGQLGNGQNKTSNVMVDVIGLEAPAISLSTSLASSCVVLSNGKTLCWGNNGNGRLGVGDTANRNVPTPVVLP